MVWSDAGTGFNLQTYVQLLFHLGACKWTGKQGRNTNIFYLKRQHLCIGLGSFKCRKQFTIILLCLLCDLYTQLSISHAAHFRNSHQVTRFLKKFIVAKSNFYPAEKLKWVTFCYANVKQPLKHKILTISKQPSNSHQVQVGVTSATMNKWAAFLLNALGIFMYSLYIIGLGFAAQFHAQLEMIRGSVSGVSKSLQRNPLLITCRGSFLSYCWSEVALCSVWPVTGDSTAKGSPHTQRLAVTSVFNTSVVLYCTQKVRKYILMSTTHLEASFCFCYFL